PRARRLASAPDLHARHAVDALHVTRHVAEARADRDRRDADADEEPRLGVEALLLDALHAAGADDLLRRQQAHHDLAHLLEVHVDVLLERRVAARRDAQLVLAEALARDQ